MGEKLKNGENKKGKIRKRKKKNFIGGKIKLKEYLYNGKRGKNRSKRVREE
jgi:hypothetical protein